MAASLTFRPEIAVVDPYAPPGPVGTGGLATDAHPAGGLALGLANALLSALTLGAYGFWGRVRVRRYLWASTRLLGEPFEYTGTGAELFRGAATALLVVLLPLYALQLAVGLGFGLPAGGAAVTMLGASYFAAVGRYRALRYRLSRTLYRGIRGGLSGGGWGYGLEALLRSLLLAATLGLSLPWMDVALARRRYAAMRLGDRPVAFQAELWPLVSIWCRCWLLLLPTLGLSYAWYLAARERTFMAGLSWEGLRLRFSARGASFAGLLLTSAAVYAAAFLGVALVSFGVGVTIAAVGLVGGSARLAPSEVAAAAWFASLIYALLGLVAVVLATVVPPVIATLWTRFYCRHLSVEGDVDWGHVAQSQLPRGRSGEGLASMFGADGF